MNQTRKKGRTFLLIIFLFIVAPPPLFAADKLFQAESEILAGLNLAYELRLKEAEELFVGLEDKYPDSPAASFYPAVIKWANAEVYNRWSQIAGIYSVTAPPKLEFPESRILIKKMEETIFMAKSILKKKPDNFEARFYLAGAYGFISRMEYLNGYYLPAIINGRRSALEFDSLLALYPKIGDAKLGPGVYKYFIGRLSPPMRAAVSLLGLRGSSEEGLKLIKEAHETGVLSKVDSADFLALIYWKREKEIKEAKKWAKRLKEVAPNSILSSYHSIMAFNSVGDLDGEENAINELLVLVKKRKIPILNEWEQLLLFASASIKEKRGQKKVAIKLCNEALKLKNNNSWLHEEITLKLKNLKKGRRALM